MTQIKGTPDLPPRWEFICGFNLDWLRWGLGVEFSFGDWVPPEIALYLHFGPVGWRIGVEQSNAWLEAKWEAEGPLRAASSEGTDTRNE